MLAETHLARAQYLYYGLRDYAGASPNWRLRGERYPMIRVSSNSPATFCGGAASRRRGLQNLQRAVELDPRNVSILCNRSRYSSNSLRRYAETIAALDRALAIVPDHVETRTTREEY